MEREVEACDIVMDLLDKARQDLDALPSDVDQYTPYLPNPPPPAPARYPFMGGGWSLAP
jgi:hypothetical protein